ncbi:RdgB/HAM1 family non-canonical purine NTP pyrophosphatase [Francisella hispaniensis]|uniref:RdgB/HAM1 family non-canonical purine NTP pyrophosphatase n=1 Tax=Francisella hispaniensis TaxID=622488 RepID=UPI001906B0E8|nr:RdgB/HAM1 family non-canonical purine NTP pyrophosphatase [Francisella hispaniensis]MBK2357582.1 RdgB/HAM1 family non-canonical purine NTP pyrophosphatase [Francisella hispaniensis]
MKEIVLASSNKGKIREFTNIFRQKNIKIVPQTNFNIPDAEEVGLSFIENAILKARNCAKYTGLPAIADDSGLEVFSLNGQPGIYSARYSGEHGNDKANIEKLLINLIGNDDRNARFVCALAYVKYELDPSPILAYGFLEGKIAHQMSGSNGFGYDPIFLLPQLQKTLAEITESEKNKISHRAIALDKIIELL